MTKTRIEKTRGAPVLVYEGEHYLFSEGRITSDEEATLTVDHDTAVRLVEAHGEVRIDEVHVVPTLEDAREDYHAAQQLARYHDLSAQGTHEELLERLTNEMRD